MRKNFYLCYTWDDMAEVRQVLNDINHDMSSAAIPFSTYEGYSYDENMKLIDDADVVVVFISNHSKKDEILRQKTLHALHVNKNIIPIEIGGRSWFGSMPPEFKFRTKPYKYRDEDSRAKLFAQFKAICGVNVQSGDAYGSLVHMVTDSPSKIYRYGEYLCVIHSGEDTTIRLAKGKHLLLFESVEYPGAVCEIQYDVKNNGSEYFLKIPMQKTIKDYVKNGKTTSDNNGNGNVDKKSKKKKGFVLLLVYLVVALVVYFVFFYSSSDYEELEYVEEVEPIEEEPYVEEEAAVVEEEPAEVGVDTVGLIEGEIYDAGDGTYYMPMYTGTAIYFPEYIGDCVTADQGIYTILNSNYNIRIEASCFNDYHDGLQGAYEFWCAKASYYDLTYKRKTETFAVVSWWNGDFGNYYRAEIHHGCIHEWRMIWHRDDHDIAASILNNGQIWFRD